MEASGDLQLEVQGSLFPVGSDQIQEVLVLQNEVWQGFNSHGPQGEDGCIARDWIRVAKLRQMCGPGFSFIPLDQA